MNKLTTHQKSLLIGGAVLTAIVAATIGVFALFGNPFTSNTGSMPRERDRFSSREPQSLSMSFVDLLALGENYTCTFSVTDEETTTDGKIYISKGGDRFRGEFDVQQANGTAMDATMIRDDMYHYMWSSQQEQGFKMKITENDDNVFPGSGIDTDTESDFAFDEYEQTDFECTRWTPDPAQFVPPSEVEFVDFSDQMMYMQGSVNTSVTGNGEASAEVEATTTTNNQEYCSVCNQISDEGAKAQCLAQLNCN